jgi:AcrR family transcriptional regulator
VQQIIEEAEVSERTFFRYFPIKAQAVRELRATLRNPAGPARLHHGNRVLAERTGCQPGGMALRTLAGAVMVVVMAVMIALADDPAAAFDALARRGSGVPRGRAQPAAGRLRVIAAIVLGIMGPVIKDQLLLLIEAL